MKKFEIAYINKDYELKKVIVNAVNIECAVDNLPTVNNIDVNAIISIKSYTWEEIV